MRGEKMEEGRNEGKRRRCRGEDKGEGKDW